MTTLTQKDWRDHVPACVRTLENPVGFPPRVMVDRYFERHILRCDALARGLAGRSTPPDGWRWEIIRTREAPEWSYGEGEQKTVIPAHTITDDLGFRKAPMPFSAWGANFLNGYCQLCGHPIYRLGWHTDFAHDGKPNERATWHAACVKAYRFWATPSDYVGALIHLQGYRCPISGADLTPGRDRPLPEVDHEIPLYRVWRERDTHPWPGILRFWGRPNLRAVTPAAHRQKCAAEARERAAFNARDTQTTDLLNEGSAA